MKTQLLTFILTCFLFLLTSCMTANTGAGVKEQLESTGTDAIDGLMSTELMNNEPVGNDDSDPASVTNDTHPSQHRLASIPFLGVAAQRSTVGLSSDRDFSVEQPDPINYNKKTEYHTNPMNESGERQFMVSVEEMELNQFVHLVYGRYLEINYVVDPAIEKKKDPVTIHMQEPVRKKVFEKFIRDVLTKYKVSIKKRGGVVYVEPANSKVVAEQDYITMVGRQLPPQIEDSEQILIFIPIHHVDASQQVNTIRQLQPLGKGKIFALDKRTLVLKADAESVGKVLTLVDLLDISSFSNQHVTLLPLHYIEPQKFVKRMKEILPVLGVMVAESPHETGVRLIPVPEIFSLLMVSPEEKWLTSIQTWADKIDTPAVLGPDPRIFIYRPRHRKASVLGGVIAGLKGNNGVDVLANKSQSSGGDESVSVAEPKKGAAVLKNENFSITIDEERNALVIYSTPAAYEEIKKTLESLDVLARQVQIEVTIVEVTLTDKLQYGVEWYLNHGGSESQSHSVLSTSGGLALGDGGISATLFRTSGGFLTMLNAFAKDDLINILANPRLVVLDNESASFSVGTDVPVVTSEASATDLKATEADSSILRNIQYRKTGILVKVKPTIYSNGILRLEIDQTISDAQKNEVSPKTDSPLILDRSLNTVVTLESGQSILLGGLISETRSSGAQKIPILGDIPVLGNLFKTSSSQTTRTELMIQIRPVILHSSEDARKETEKFEQLVEGLRGLSSFFSKPEVVQ